MTTVKEHERAAPYSKLKAKMSARLAFTVMLKQLEKNIDRALKKDRLAGWPEDMRRRIQEGGP